MKNDNIRRGFIVAFALFLVVTMVGPWPVVSADTIISDEIIFPKNPELVAELDIRLDYTDIVGAMSFTAGDETEEAFFYFYSFDDLSKFDENLALMLDCYNQGYYLGLYNEPWPAVSVVGEYGNNATIWYAFDDDIRMPIMLIGDAGTYSLTDEIIIEGEQVTVSFTVDLPSAGIVVLQTFVGWTGRVYVFKSVQENGLISVTGQAFTACISWLGNVVASLVSGEMSGLMNCLVLGVGVSVFIVVVVTMRRKQK